MSTSSPLRPSSLPGLPGRIDDREFPPQGSGQGPDGQVKPVSIGPTFLAAAAILTGSSALGTPISGSTWVFPLVEVVAVIWLVGVGCRLIRLPAVVTALLQLAGFVVALTSLFTSSGIGGVLPNRAAVAEAGALLSGAWDQIVGTSPPAPSTPELSFLIAVSIGCAAFIADFLVAEARAPALVALPLLCLYSVPASIANTMLPWYSFAFPAVLYAALLAVTGHPGRRTGTRAGVGMAVNGGAITALATVAALLVAASATSIGTTGRLPRTSGGAHSTIGLSPLASLRGALQHSDPVNVLTAAGLSKPGYFRTVSLLKWTPNEGFSLGDLQADVSDVHGQLDGSSAPSANPPVTVTTLAYQDRFLPIMNGTTAVNGLDVPWDWDATSTTIFRNDKVKPGSYSLNVDSNQPESSDLRQDTVVPGGDLTETGSLPKQVRDEAAAVTAGSVTAFDKADALRKWFTDPANGFTYSLEVPAGNSGDALVDFLNNKKGFCEQYAAAMAIMLRSLNIPTRVVVGFTQGVRQPDGSYLVTSHDAHAWVEVKFVKSGWVSFDPTPPVGGQGGQQGFHEDAAPITTAATTTTARPSVSTKVRLPEESTKASVSTAVATQIDVAGAAGGSSSGLGRFVLITLLAVAVLIALLLLPTALRLRRRRTRLGAAGAGAPGGASAAWSEIEDTAIDHGILPHSAESARVMANRLAKRAHLEPADRARLRGVVIAAEREWYGDSELSDGDLTPGTSAVNAADPGGSLRVLERPAQTEHGTDLAGAARSVIKGLHVHAKISLIERIVPRSMRRSGR